MRISILKLRQILGRRKAYTITLIKLTSKLTDHISRHLLEPDMNKAPTLGEMDGIIEIPNDFNEPLDEMKEYMY